MRDMHFCAEIHLNLFITLLVITIKDLDITQISAGPQIMKWSSKTGFLYNYTFFSHYNTVWITNMEIGLDPNNSVIKRLWCIIL